MTEKSNNRTGGMRSQNIHRIIGFIQMYGVRKWSAEMLKKQPK